jgi:hypothetical protein
MDEMVFVWIELIMELMEVLHLDVEHVSSFYMGRHFVLE